MDGNHKLNFRKKKEKSRNNLSTKKSKMNRWVIKLSITAFLISTIISMMSSKILQDVNIFIAFVMLLVIILIGIFFDMIGISVTAAEEAPFHAMASRKMPGAKHAIYLIRNANKVSSFCNDVVGDICGVLSGSIGALIVVEMIQKFSWPKSGYLGFAITGLIASLTIGGKALGKTVAIQKRNQVVYKVSFILNLIIRRINLDKSRKK